MFFRSSFQQPAPLVAATTGWSVFEVEKDETVAAGSPELRVFPQLGVNPPAIHQVWSESLLWALRRQKVKYRHLLNMTLGPVSR